MFRPLLEVSQTTQIRAQSNDRLMLLMGYDYAGEIIREQKAGLLPCGRLLLGDVVK
jgi:hypothetical protein